jgi:hypothetical protein
MTNAVDLKLGTQATLVAGANRARLALVRHVACGHYPPRRLSSRMSWPLPTRDGKRHWERMRILQMVSMWPSARSPMRRLPPIWVTSTRLSERYWRPDDIGDRKTGIMPSVSVTGCCPVHAPEA